jgi:hypothetical protein
MGQRVECGRRHFACRWPPLHSRHSTGAKGLRLLDPHSTISLANGQIVPYPVTQAARTSKGGRKGCLDRGSGQRRGEWSPPSKRVHKSRRLRGKSRCLRDARDAWRDESLTGVDRVRADVWVEPLRRPATLSTIHAAGRGSTLRSNATGKGARQGVDKGPHRPR